MSTNTPLAVIMCTWKRPHYFQQTIKYLESQKDQQFDFFIWNNNPSIKSALEHFLNSSEKFQKAFIHHSPENIGGFGRFYIAQDIAHQYPYVTFIDDDFCFDDELISICKNQASKQTLKSSWAWNIYGSYWRRSRVGINNRADFCGTSVMVADSSIFTEKQLFECPTEYWFIEDLWLSFYASHIMGWSLLGMGNINAREQTIGKQPQWIELLQKKQEFYHYLVNNKGWDPQKR